MKKVTKKLLLFLLVSSPIIIQYSCKNDIENAHVLTLKRNLRVGTNFYKNGAYQDLLKNVINSNKAVSNHKWKFKKSSEAMQNELAKATNEADLESILELNLTNSAEFKSQIYKIKNSIELFAKENPELFKLKDGRNIFANEFKADLLAIRKSEFKKLKVSDYGWCYGGCNGSYWTSMDYCDAGLAFGITIAYGLGIYSGGYFIPVSALGLASAYLGYAICNSQTWDSYSTCVNGCPI